MNTNVTENNQQVDSLFYFPIEEYIEHFTDFWIRHEFNKYVKNKRDKIIKNNIEIYALNIKKFAELSEEEQKKQAEICFEGDIEYVWTRKLTELKVLRENKPKIICNILGLETKAARISSKIALRAYVLKHSQNMVTWGKVDEIGLIKRDLDLIEKQIEKLTTNNLDRKSENHSNN